MNRELRPPESLIIGEATELELTPYIVGRMIVLSSEKMIKQEVAYERTV